MEEAWKLLAASGPWGVVVLVLVRVILHLYRKNERLRDERTAALEAMASRHADEQRGWQQKQLEQNVAMREVIKSLARKAKQVRPGDDDSEGS